MIEYNQEKWIEELSKNDLHVPLYQKIIKLQEEVGELSQAYLAYIDSSNQSKSATGSTMGVIEELCDTINVSMDIINYLTYENAELETLTKNMFNKKLQKWEDKQND